MIKPECECGAGAFPEKFERYGIHLDSCPYGSWLYFETFTDEQRGEHRDDAGSCTVCGADLTMWCDLVAHRQVTDEQRELWFDTHHPAGIDEVRIKVQMFAAGIITIDEVLA